MNDDKKPSILVTLVEAGMGHIVAAQAIYEALKNKYGEVFDISACHILRDSGNKSLIKYENYLVKNVKMYSSIRGFGYLQIFSMFLLGPRNTLEIVYNTAFKKQVNALVAEYDKKKPDVIICTHFFTHYCAVKYKQKHNPKVKVVSYCPDNNVHGWWHVKGDMIYTNNPLATAEAYKLGFKSGSVKEAFYPTRKQVAQATESKQFYREKFNIPADKLAVAISDGVYAQAKAAKICKKLLKSNLPLTVCMLTGKDEKIKTKLDRLKETAKPNITLMTYGFVDNAPELYAACDLFVTKGGPNAILDSVMMQTPVIVDFCATPIESKTCDLFVKKHRCGYYIKSPSKIKRKVEELILNPALLRQFDTSLKYFDKNANGAQQVADDIASLVLDEKAHKHNLQERENEIVDKYYALRKHGGEQKETFKSRLHSGKNNRKFAKMLEEVNK